MKYITQISEKKANPPLERKWTEDAKRNLRVKS